MSLNQNSFRVVGIAGKIASGKSSLAIRIAQATGGRVVSFGEFVRMQAISRNVATDRANLQELGEKLILELGEEEFVKRAFGVNDLSNSLLILDGVRHVSIWETVCKLTPRALLIYLDTSALTRKQRLMQRDQIQVEDIESVLNHPMEVNIPNLQSLAHFTWNESIDDSLLFKLIEATSIL